MHRLPPRLLLCLIAVAMAGCSKPSRPPELQYDSGQARQTLLTALDAWKRGQAAQLAGAQPPIRFVDDDLADGCQLVDFQPPSPDARLEPFTDIPVALVLRDRRGNVVNRNATYQIGLMPHLSVLRTDR
jgi:hypothetical protein